MKERFDNKGRFIVPLNSHKKETKIEDKRFVVSEAYCTNGHNLIDKEHEIGGFPGIKLKFKRPGHEGEFVISAIEGEFDKIILSGELEEGKKDELSCPFCGAILPSLTNCECVAKGNLVVLGLTPILDFNNAIAFCDVTGCKKGTFVKSGTIINHMRLTSW